MKPGILDHPSYDGVVHVICWAAVNHFSHHIFPVTLLRDPLSQLFGLTSERNLWIWMKLETLKSLQRMIRMTAIEKCWKATESTECTALNGPRIPFQPDQPSAGASEIDAKPIAYHLACWQAHSRAEVEAEKTKLCLWYNDWTDWSKTLRTSNQILLAHIAHIPWKCKARMCSGISSMHRPRPASSYGNARPCLWERRKMRWGWKGQR